MKRSKYIKNIVQNIINKIQKKQRLYKNEYSLW